MRSRLAEKLRQEQAAKALALTAGDRLRLALALGARDLDQLARLRGVTAQEARQHVRATRQAGRRASASST